MVKFTYIDMINAIQNEETVKLIGHIDTKLLNSGNLKSLYYSFPLIERMVLEIYKLIPEADVEKYEQGIMKTTMSIINSCNNIIAQKSIELLKKYYDGEDCLRNKLFHPREQSITIKINFKEINYLIMQLLSVLRNKLEENNKYEFKNIEHL